MLQPLPKGGLSLINISLSNYLERSIGNCWVLKEGKSRLGTFPNSLGSIEKACHLDMPLNSGVTDLNVSTLAKEEIYNVTNVLFIGKPHHGLLWEFHNGLKVSGHIVK